MKDIQFTFTVDQQRIVAEYFGKDVNDLQVYEISELLDELIDDKLSIK